MKVLSILILIVTSTLVLAHPGHGEDGHHGYIHFAPLLVLLLALVCYKVSQRVNAASSAKPASRHSAVR